MNRIDAKFRQLKKSGGKAFIAFITAGYPDLETTYKLILEFSRIGVDILELGVPFSDPIADGPVIQEASQAALKAKVNLKDILRLVRRVRRKTGIPICLMTYYNPVYCFGEAKFVKDASGSGVDGLIIPDLPPEEAGSLLGCARRCGLDTIFFISPTSSDKHIRLISKASGGFIYYVSLTGTTGARSSIAQDFLKNLQNIKKITSKPVCAGFGISTPQQVKYVCGIADGAIIGSAIVKKIRENLKRRDLVKRVGRYVNYLKGRNV